MSISGTRNALLGRSPGQGLPRIVSSRGHEIVGQSGEQYLDAISGAYAAILGYSLCSVTTAMYAAAARLPYVHNARFDSCESVALANLLSELGGSAGYQVYLSVSGADGVEAALRIAAAYGEVRGRSYQRQWAALPNSYHGSSGFALSTTGHAAARGRYELELKRITRLDLLRWVRTPRGFDADWTTDRAEIERAIGKDIGVVILEPMLGNAAGCVEMPDSTLAAIAAVCRERDIVLISDEVSVGMWRTDGLSLSQSKGVDPDIIVLGKALTAGLFPLSAVLVSPRIALALQGKANLLGHTHAAHPIGCAVALDVLRHLTLPRFQSDVEGLKDAFATRLADLLRLERVRAIRGRGLMYSVCLNTPEDETVSGPIGERLYAACLSRGLLVMPGEVRGTDGVRVSDHITLAPAFNMPVRTLNHVVHVLTDALAEL
ncbi:aminotransferase class III-fold pyridoxal phosphate-dependent enzyme [Paraburkholderia denitrificans]|uniref:Aminotransferase class III-fold pyridoxal phosphate-dependent enzyme n=1 Tax=Paraburkholderia denitrificans TaxID=694025 RepID=A0ABW0J7B6_9BURK